MKKLIRSSAVLALAVGSMFSLSTVADAGAQSGKKVVYFDYHYQPSVKPTSIFLTANSGPYLTKLKWTGWGTEKAVGRGRFIADCASCGPKENRRVRFTFHKKVTCKYAPNVQIYRYGKIHVIDKSRKRVSSWNGNCPSKGWRN